MRWDGGQGRKGEELQVGMVGRVGRVRNYSCCRQLGLAQGLAEFLETQGGC